MQGHGTPPPIPPRHLKPSLSVNQTLQASEAVAVTTQIPTFEHHEGIISFHEAISEVHDDHPEITTNVEPVTTLGVGTGLNAVRFVASSTNNHVTSDVDEIESMGYYYSIPDSIIGQGSLVQGTVTFQKLLRLDGRFEGKLISTGTVIIGPTGVLHGDLISATLLTVEGNGRVLGNVTADKVVLKGKSIVQGDVTCKGMQMDMDALLVGQMNIHPHAPNALSVSLDPPLSVDHDSTTNNNNNNSSSSNGNASSTDISTAAIGAPKGVDISNTQIHHEIIPTSTSISTADGEDDSASSASTVVVHSSLPASKEGDVVVGSGVNESGSGLAREDSMGAISWKERAIGDDG